MLVFKDLKNLPKFRNPVLTIGSFDGVHEGHRQILGRLRTLAEECSGTSVVITFDPHPRTILQSNVADFQLITSTYEKIDLLRNEGIDVVVVVPFNLEFAQQSAKDYVETFLLKQFNPRYIVIGYDHRFGAQREGNIDLIKKYEQPGKLEVIEIPKLEVDALAVSSSKIRKALENADLAHAERLLGHRFSMRGRVVEGQKIGRTIGCPTANLTLDDAQKLVLPEGVYAAWTIFQEQKHAAMLYIGRRPVLQGVDNQTIEVNILNFDKNIYGENLIVEPVQLVRRDEEFDHLDALRQQIERDREHIHELLQRDERSRVAVVILNYNTRAHLARFLPSVLKNTPPEVKIVVADNGSSDDSVEFLQKNYPQVQVLALPQNFGFAEGYNQALRQVSAEFYFILNSDVELTENWLPPLLDELRSDQKIAVVQPKIRSIAQPERFEYAGAAGGWMDTLGYPFCRGRIFFHLEADSGQHNTSAECFWASGAAFFIRAKLYHAFGGFDGDYFAHNEEIDLCWRLKRAGLKVKCVPQSTVFHLGGGTLDYQSARKTFLNVRNSLFSLLKNEPVSKLWWAIPIRLTLDGVAAAVFLLKGQWRSTLTIAPAHFSFYKNLPATLRKRRLTRRWIENFGNGAPANRQGIFNGSIVWMHYIRRVKNFFDLGLK